MAEYHRNVLVELGLYDEGSCMQILTDSKGAKALVGNPVQRQRTKHIGPPFHYVRLLVDEGVVMFGRVALKDNAVDDLTKAASRPFHSFAARKFGLTVEDSSVFIQR